MLRVKILTVNNFEESTYVLIDEATKKAAIVDPGFLYPAEFSRLENLVDVEKIVIEQVILTHGHLDHCFGVGKVRDRYGVPVKGHVADAPLLKSVAGQASRFGMSGVFASEPTLDIELKDGDTIAIGDSTLTVIHVPGHSPGGIALYDAEDRFVIVGDSLFRQSIGRTDLPGGDHRTLIDSIKKKLLTLPDNTVVLPGHGPATTIGAEKSGNPYLV